MKNSDANSQKFIKENNEEQKEIFIERYYKKKLDFQSGEKNKNIKNNRTDYNRTQQLQ